MSSFLRYAGLAMIFSAIVLIFFQRRGQLRKAFTEAAVFGIVAGAPLAAWAIFHNFPSTGTFLGSHRPSDFIGLFIVAVEKIAGWFVPERLLQIIPALIVVGILIFAVIARSSRTRWSSWSQRIQQSNILPSAIFFAIYGAMLVLAISYSEHRIPGSQRIHAVILPALLVLVAITWQEFAPRSNPFWGKILVAVFAIWLMFPLYRVTAYVSASMQSGDISFYNLYNTRTLRQSDIVSELSQLDLPNEEKIYSNNEGAAWFYLRRRIYRLPRYDADSNQDLATAILEFDGWPGADETATLVWFKRELDYKEDVPTPEQLQGFIRLSPTFTGRNGAIYLLDVDPK
jgi:hypothetical protein